VLEQKRESELAAVESALRLADDDGAEAALLVTQIIQQISGPRSAPSRKGTGQTGVEVLTHDLPADGRDQRLCPRTRPVA
jgi:hypothetical protein